MEDSKTSTSQQPQQQQQTASQPLAPAPPPPASLPSSSPSSADVFAVDAADVEYVSTRFEHYLVLYERDVRQRLMQLLSRHHTDNQTIAAQHDAIARLQHQLDQQSNALHAASSAASSLSSAVSSLRDKHIALLIRYRSSLDLAQSFRQWRGRSQAGSRRRQAAEERRGQLLLRQTMGSWRSGVRLLREERQRQETDDAVERVRAETVSLREEEVRRLKAELRELLVVIRLHEREKGDREERMRQAFVRGVCALNKEAMSVFGNGTAPEEEKEQDEQAAATAAAAAAGLSPIPHTAASASQSSSSANSSVIQFQPIPLRLSHPYPPTQLPSVSGFSSASSRAQQQRGGAGSAAASGASRAGGGMRAQSNKR